MMQRPWGRFHQQPLPYQNFGGGWQASGRNPYLGRGHPGGGYNRAGRQPRRQRLQQRPAQGYNTVPVPPRRHPSPPRRYPSPRERYPPHPWSPPRQRIFHRSLSPPPYRHRPNAWPHRRRPYVEPLSRDWPIPRPRLRPEWEEPTDMVRQFRDAARHPRRPERPVPPPVPEPRALANQAGVPKHFEQHSKEPKEALTLFPGPLVAEPEVPEGIYGTFDQQVADPAPPLVAPQAPFIAPSFPPFPRKGTPSEPSGIFAEDYEEPVSQMPSLSLFQRLKNFFMGKKPEAAEIEERHELVSFPGFPVNDHIMHGQEHTPHSISGSLRRHRLSMMDVEAIREKVEEEKKEEEADLEGDDSVVEQEIVDEVIKEIIRPSVKRKSMKDATRRKFARELQRTQLLADPKLKLSGIKKWKYEKAKQWQKMKLGIVSFLDYFTIWSSSFKSIEGHFGSSIVSYFTFVKWLLLVNLLVTLMTVAIIVFPQEFMEPDTFMESIANVTEDSRATIFQLQAYNCSLDYDNYIAGTTNQTIWYEVIDFFQGTGWMENTVLFIGYYFNKTLMYEEDEVFYNMPLAYLLCTAAYFSVTLILMVNVAARGRKQRVLTSGDKFQNTCNKVFCSWDYALCQEKAAILKHRNLFREYTSDLEEQRRAEARKNMGRLRRLRIYITRLVINLFVVALLGACGFLIYTVTSDWMPALLDEESVQDNRLLTLLVEFLPSITITLLYVAIPPIFQKVVLVEDYAPETEMRITIARTVFLRLASIAFLVITLVIQITCEDDDKVCGNCPLKDSYFECWETYFGQQMYKLIILDFIIVVFLTFLVEFPRRVMVHNFPNSKLLQFVGLQEFEIPQNVLDIVYSQTLCWIGGFFSPLVPAITVVKFFVFFYVKKLTLMKNCIPSTRPYRASRSSSFFMTILMMSFVLCVLPIAYAVGRIPPSQGCGPFRVYSSTTFYMYSTITDGISTLESVVQDVLNFIGSYMFYVPTIIILCLIIYYYQALAAANKRMGELLRQQLSLERMDKQFLLARVNDALRRGEIVDAATM